MTREEAITLLHEISDQCCEIANILCTENADKRCEAIDMAIEALSADTIPIERYHELQHQFVMLGAAFADLTAVVRCKDCRWWKGCQETKHNNHLCKRALDQNIEYWTKADDFCSYGERREP